MLLFVHTRLAHDIARSKSTPSHGAVISRAARLRQLRQTASQRGKVFMPAGMLAAQGCGCNA
jgi:hypothetical protein